MDNIMFGAGDDTIFHEFEQQELESPSPRKEVDGCFIYVSRELNIPEDLEMPVLCDFGSAVTGDQTNTKDVQPNLYRAPEVILQVPWSYEIDIWNVGCMVGMPLPRLLNSFINVLQRLRSGTCLKAAISSPARTRNTRPTAAGRTLPV
jgi:serine/threonine protein kinase